MKWLQVLFLVLENKTLKTKVVATNVVTFNATIQHSYEYIFLNYTGCLIA